MRQFIEQLHLIAKFPIDVLMYGQTGSGKDYFARYLHHISNREGAFIAINCAAIPENLAETELFGVETGAYTGAQKRMGKIEAANNGTLYLDEIDSMPLNMQAKLLRALQERGAERIGSNRFIASNFCLVASSKVDLQQAVLAGKFREDLYHRLSTAPVVLPQLNQRIEDILPLFQSQAESFALVFKVTMPEITPQIQCELLGHDWPGNVRELIACTQRFVIGLPLFISSPNLGETQNIHLSIKNSSNIEPNHQDAYHKKSTKIVQKNFTSDQLFFKQSQENIDSLIAKLESGKNADLNLKEMMAIYEKEIISLVLMHFKYSLKNSAAFLNLPVSTLHQKIKSLKLRI